MSSTPSSWSLAIFAARETPEALARCVRAAIAACAGQQATINVLVNGNPQLARDFAPVAAGLDHPGVQLRIWSIAAPDKAHTWNEYVYRIWDGNSTAFFIDGYALVRPDALLAMQQRLLATPEALAVTGVPTSGRSAARVRAQMLREGGIHGNLFGITCAGMEGIRHTGFRLPLGIYRTDPLIGSVLMYRLDPARHRWNPHSVVVEPAATWQVEGIEELNWKNIKTQFKRVLRQAQGELENRAAREHLSIRKLPPQQLPLTVAEMIDNWLVSQPAQARALFLRRPLCRYAIRKLRAPRDWSATGTSPELVLGSA